MENLSFDWYDLHIYRQTVSKALMAMNTSKHPIPITYMYYTSFLSPLQVLSDGKSFFYFEYKIRNDLCGDLKELSYWFLLLMFHRAYFWVLSSFISTLKISLMLSL